MKSAQKGFTLIELVVVLVILGILAATAVPRFINLSNQANVAATQGVAGSMGSAMAINYAGCSAVNHDTTQDQCVAVTGCSDYASVMQDVPPSTKYAVTTASAPATTTNGETGTCTVTNQDDTSITDTFTVIVAGQ